MYKNLNPSALGISGRQSELIELAMTYGFKGLDIDLNDLVKRTKRSSFEHAGRYLKSADIGVSGFEVPVDLDADDASFEKAVADLPNAMEIAQKVGATRGSVRLPAATDRLPFNEYFEVLRKRVAQIADVMAKQEILLGIYFTAATELRKDKQFRFVCDTEGFLAFFNASAHANIGVTLDTWSWFVSGGNAQQIADLDVKKVVAVRLADADPSITTENASVRTRLMPGTDKAVANTPVVKQLASKGYKGPIAAVGHQSTLSGMTRDAIVSHAQDCLDIVLTNAGLDPHTRKPEMFVDLYQPAYANAE